MSEIFQIIFNTQGANVLGGRPTTDLARTTVTFNVNWGAYLPTKYKRFVCEFVFKSETYAVGNGLLTNNGFVNLNLGRMNIIDGTTMCSNLGIIYPVIMNTTAGSQTSFYCSTNNDNNPCWVNYPTNNVVTITLLTLPGTTPMATMPHWCLILNLKGIPDSEIN